MVSQALDTDLAPAQLAASISTQVDAVNQPGRSDRVVGRRRVRGCLANAYTRSALRCLRRSHSRARLAEAERLLEDQLRGGAHRTSLPRAFQVGTITNQLQRVRLLRETSEPVVVERSGRGARRSGFPAARSEHVLGALVGLLLGLLAAFVRDALDRRIRNPHDVHAELGRPVLRHVERDDLRLSRARRVTGW